MAKKLVVDQEKCIGCGTCVALTPEVFELNDEGKARLKLQAPSSPAKQDPALRDKLQAKIQEAIESCPVEAISWEEQPISP